MGCYHPGFQWLISPRTCNNKYTDALCKFILPIPQIDTGPIRPSKWNKSTPYLCVSCTNIMTHPYTANFWHHLNWAARHCTMENEIGSQLFRSFVQIFIWTLTSFNCPLLLVYPLDKTQMKDSNCHLSKSSMFPQCSHSGSGLTLDGTGLVRAGWKSLDGI